VRLPSTVCISPAVGTAPASESFRHAACVSGTSKCVHTPGSGSAPASATSVNPPPVRTTSASGCGMAGGTYSVRTSNDSVPPKYADRLPMKAAGA
jgi:hypothetical protein